MESVRHLAALAGTVPLAAWALWRFHWFNRDPDREPPPESADSVLAAADGTILYVRRVERDEPPVCVKNGHPVPLAKFVGRTGLRGPGYLIGTFMHPTSVHVNRAPIAGTVLALQHEAGSNLPMNLTWIRVHLGLHPLERDAAHLLTNERNLMVIRNDRMWACVVQIADYFVNRIECWVKEGECVEQAQRVGRIRFGSQVDVFFPALEGLTVRVAPGRKVRAGVDVLATISRLESGEPRS